MWEGQHREAVKLIGQKRIIARLLIEFGPGEYERADELCVVDTGADMTTIPQRIWKWFLTEGSVRAGEKSNPKGVGGSVEVFKHRLTLRLRGLGDHEPLVLGECDVWLAFDESAGKPMRQVLFGVGGGALDKGGLCINWKQGQFWFVEVM